MVAAVLSDAVERSAQPAAAARALERMAAAHPGLEDRLAGDPTLRAALVAVAAASPWLARVCSTDPLAIEVLAGLDRPVDPERLGEPGDAGAWLARWKRLEMLRIAARDLTGRDDLEGVTARLSTLAGAILDTAYHLAAGAERTTGGEGAGGPELAVVAMGKLGAGELNYASDIDVVLVGDADPRPMLALARRAWRVDLDLRPEGRAGRLVRSLPSYEAYWDRWADAWEFQALLKARTVAGDRTLGRRFEAAAADRVWGRPFGADELHELRAMKARAEAEVTRRGLARRELKRGPGGIRDIEFAVQLLQLVHGRADPSLRAPGTLAALTALAAGGYVSRRDASALEAAYRFLRTVEHRLQLHEDQQVHALPGNDDGVVRLARVLGYRDAPAATAAGQFEQDLRRHQATARQIHERLFFRPLLEAFTTSRELPGGAAAAGGAGEAADRRAALSPAAVEDRLAAFGFSDAARTRQAVRELTRGLSRSSRLMQQILPLLLVWLSEAPAPDLGLLGLRTLAAERHTRDQVVALCRESPEAARQLCLLLGTAPLFAPELRHRPDLLAGLATGESLAGADRATLDGNAARQLAWRAGEQAVPEGLRQLLTRERLRIAARDVLGLADVEATGQALSDLAEVVVSAALAAVEPEVPMAVIAMGSLGGRELSYASDLDLLVVYDAGATDAGGAAEGPGGHETARAAERAATALVRLLDGATPATRLYRVDTALRPEGRQGPVARSLDAYAAYYHRWAEPWERQALLRGRFCAGDRDVGERFAALAEEFVWNRPFGSDDERAIRRTKARVERERIPAGEDPSFHLKLGRGSLSDVVWTAQLLQLRAGVRATGTTAALEALVAAGALSAADGQVLTDAYRFCERTRNRLHLVRGVPTDSLPSTGPHLTTLARSLGTTASDLREEYRRVTRRARRVVERVFYAQPPRAADGAQARSSGRPT